jgi:hypothetical protein
MSEKPFTNDELIRRLNSIPSGMQSGKTILFIEALNMRFIIDPHAANSPLINAVIDVVTACLNPGFDVTYTIADDSYTVQQAK